MTYLELTEDQMVEELREIQILARNLLNTGRANPYDKRVHEKATVIILCKLNKLALSGDVV